MPEAPAALASFAEAAAFARARFECSGSSESHVRLQVRPAGTAPEGGVGEADGPQDTRPAAPQGAASGIRCGAPQPVTLYHGRSAASKDRELVHIASPLLGVGFEQALDAAALMDSMPLGGLRLLGEHLHVHDSLPLPGVDGTTLEATIRLVASEAAALRSELGEAASNSAEPADSATVELADSAAVELSEAATTSAEPAERAASTRRPADTDRSA